MQLNSREDPCEDNTPSYCKTVTLFSLCFASWLVSFLCYSTAAVEEGTEAQVSLLGALFSFCCTGNSRGK